MVCAPEAFIDKSVYQMTMPPRLADPAAQDKAFRKWQAGEMAKLPVTGNAYSLLRECWEHYHGKAK